MTLLRPYRALAKVLEPFTAEYEIIPIPIRARLGAQQPHRRWTVLTARIHLTATGVPLSPHAIDNPQLGRYRNSHPMVTALVTLEGCPFSTGLLTSFL